MERHAPSARITLANVRLLRTPTTWSFVSTWGVKYFSRVVFVKENTRIRSCLRNVPLLGTNSFAFGFCKNISRGKQKVQFSVGRKNKNTLATCWAKENLPKLRKRSPLGKNNARFCSLIANSHYVVVRFDLGSKIKKPRRIFV